MTNLIEVYNTENVCVRLVSIPPGGYFTHGRSGKNSLAIPLDQLEHHVPFDILLNYLLHHSPPKQWQTLHNTSNVSDETFVELLWRP